MKRILVPMLLAVAPKLASAAPGPRLLEERLTFQPADSPPRVLTRSAVAYQIYPGYPAPVFVGPRAPVREGIDMIVAGAILGAIGTPFVTVGGYFLWRSVTATGDALTTYTALGWSLGGVGALLWVIAAPILIVGIVKVATRGGYVYAPNSAA